VRVATEREAAYYERRAGGLAVCRLCPKSCRIPPGRRGFCRTRGNVDGTLYALNYGRVAAVHLDPVEKKPLFHFYPGHTILSFGTFGCNLACAFCQNWSISQEDAPTRPVAPEELARLAEECRQEDGSCVGVAFTYNEPGMWFETILDAAPLCRRRGLKVAMVSNGYLSPEPLRDLVAVVDAFNIDVKAMNRGFYTRVCRGTLEPVLAAVEAIRAAGRHVEVTHLVIPGENDREEDFRRLVDWLAGVGEDIPLHLSRYHPAYRMTRPPTPTATLERFREIARERLRYVYLGNTWRPGDDDTCCHACGRRLIARDGFFVTALDLDGDRCPACGTRLAGVGLAEARVSGR